MSCGCPSMYSRVFAISVGYLILVLGIALPYWTSFTADGDNTDFISGYEGLWRRCENSGNVTCCTSSDPVGEGKKTYLELN